MERRAIADGSNCKVAVSQVRQVLHSSVVMTFAADVLHLKELRTRPRFFPPWAGSFFVGSASTEHAAGAVTARQSISATVTGSRDIPTPWHRSQVTTRRP